MKLFLCLIVCAAAAKPSHASYKIINTGTCEQSGYVTITDLKECGVAGKSLKINDYCKKGVARNGKQWCSKGEGFRWDMPAKGYNTRNNGRTRGCTVHAGNGRNGMQHFPTATGKCGTANFHCVCKLKPAPVPQKNGHKAVKSTRKHALKTRAPTPLPTRTSKFSKTKTHKDTTTHYPTAKVTAKPTMKPTRAPTRRALSRCNWSATKKVIEGWRGAGYGNQYCNLYHCNTNGKLSVVGKKRPCGHKPKWANKKCTHTKCYYRYTKESPKERLVQVIGHHKETGGKSHQCVYMLPKALKKKRKNGAGLCSCYCWGKPNVIWAPAVKGAKF